MSKQSTLRAEAVPYETSTSMQKGFNDALVQRPRWLIVVPEIPRPDRAGGDRRLAEILADLGRSCDLFLVCTRPRGENDERYEDGLKAAGVRLLGYGKKAGVQALVRYRFHGIFFEFYYSTDLLLRLSRQLQPHALVMVDSVDLHYLREREAARIGAFDPRGIEESERWELTVYRKADITVVVSETERGILRAQGFNDVAVVPIIVPIVPRVERERQPELLFIGGFRHTPNGAAVAWFHENVWPLVRARVPNAGWAIAGSSVPENIQAMDGHDGIRVLGFVESTVPLLDAAQVSIAPLTFGAGMKGKVCEALAAGVPVVTTAWGAQGLEEGSNVAFLQADNPEAFADAVVLLLTDATARARLSTAAQALALKLCSQEAAVPAIAELVRRSRASGPGFGLPRRLLALAQLGVAHAVTTLRR